MGKQHESLGSKRSDGEAGGVMGMQAKSWGSRSSHHVVDIALRK